MALKLWMAVAAYAGLFALGLFTYLYRLREFKKWLAKNSVVMKSYEGDLMSFPQSGTPYKIDTNTSLGKICVLTITNLSNHRVVLTALWMEGCGKDGSDLWFRNTGFPMALDVGDQIPLQLPKQIIEKNDWFNCGRVRLSDGSVVSSVKDDAKRIDFGVKLNVAIPEDPLSPQSPKRDP